MMTTVSMSYETLTKEINLLITHFKERKLPPPMSVAVMLNLMLFMHEKDRKNTEALPIEELEETLKDFLDFTKNNPLPLQVVVIEDKGETKKVH